MAAKQKQAADAEKEQPVFHLDAEQFEKVIDATESIDPELRTRAGLCMNNCPGHEELQGPVLLRMLNDPNPEAALVPLMTLGTVIDKVNNPAEYIGPLLRRLEAAIPGTQVLYHPLVTAAAYAAIKIEDEAPESLKDFLPMLYAMARCSGASSKASALAVFAVLGPEAVEALPEIAAGLAHQEAPVVQWALIAAQRMGKRAEPLRPRLIELLEHDSALMAQTAGFILNDLDQE